MKHNKAKYMSVFFLFCFAVSFGLNVFQSVNTKLSKDVIIKTNSVSVSAKQDPLNGNNNFVFEKNESESENSFNIQATIVLFLISLILSEQIVSRLTFTSFLSSKRTNPIYLSVCNFRI